MTVQFRPGILSIIFIYSRYPKALDRGMIMDHFFLHWQVMVALLLFDLVEVFFLSSSLSSLKIFSLIACMLNELGHLVPNFVNLLIVDRAFLLGGCMATSIVNHHELYLMFGCECCILLGSVVIFIDLDVTIVITKINMMFCAALLAGSHFGNIEFMGGGVFWAI